VKIEEEKKAKTARWFWRDESDGKIEEGKRKRKRAESLELRGRLDVASGRRQLEVGSILDHLVAKRPHDAICLIALTMEDLYDEKPDLFVAGMARGNKRVAVFSFHRYDPLLSFSSEFWHSQWYISPTEAKLAADERERLILERSCRLLVHEAGHLLGLGHCIYYACCMNGSGHLQEDFSQPMHLCPIDLRKLHCLSAFDPVARYKSLTGFCVKEGLTHIADWLQRAVNSLESNK
jgi:archaemetzincin